MSSILDQEYAMRLYVKDERDSARKEGIETEKKELTGRLYDKGYSLTDIAEIVNVDIEKVREWLDLKSGS